MSEIPLTEVRHPVLQERNISLRLLREDLNHPLVGGNKWRKLKHNLLVAKERQSQGIVSIGGSFSNHLYALAAVSKELGLESIGLVRESGQRSNPTLDFIRSQGMDLQFISRSEYRMLRKDFSLIEQEFPRYYHVPEGGSNLLAFQGCKEISDSIPKGVNVVCVPVGTACTISGVIDGLDASTEVIGFPALKENYLEQNIERFLPESHTEKNWRLERAFHLGGIGSFSDDLITFLNGFYSDYKIRLDPIYNGKMLFGLFQMISNNKFAEGTIITAVLTGGLQGIAGFNFRFGPLLTY